MTRIAWLDCSSGISGDMLLGALEEVGALRRMPDLLASLHDLEVACTAMPTVRRGLGATAFQVTGASGQPRRRLADVLSVVDRADVPDAVRERAARVFRRLAEVEAQVHHSEPSDVHFHEVGAVDSIVDVLAGCLGLSELAVDRLVVSPIALGGGSVQSEHGTLPVPTPAALGLLAGSPLVGHGGPSDVELATPTGIALLAEWATECGPMPAMSVTAVGTGAGTRDLPDRANVVRLVTGTVATADLAAGETGWQTIAANVDDLDPRVWPHVLEQLLAAGAADAWLTPILMKKGRPAHTVSALTGPDALPAVRDVLVRETSTIGIRTTAVAKHALDRSWITVDVDGEKIRVKLAHDGPRRTNLAPEFDDVAAAATVLGAPVKDILARATAAALRSLDD
jgi:uncharacterized protein (TIGR00299 family) protein